MDGVFETLSKYRGGVSQRLLDQGNFLLTANNSRNRNSPWVCPLPIGDVTYPQALNVKISAFGNTGAQTAGTAHTHSLPGGNVSYASAAWWQILQNDSLGSYLSISNTANMDLVGVGVMSDDPITGGSVQLQVFREHPGDSSMELLLNYDITADVSTDFELHNFLIADGVIMREGEWYLIRVVNWTDPAVTVRVLGLAWQTGCPIITHETNGETDTDKTSYTNEEANDAVDLGNTLVWGMVGKFTPAAEDKTYADDFNRVNLGPQWANGGTSLGGSGDLVIVNNRLCYSGTVDGGFQEATLIHSTNGDACRVDADFHEMDSPDAIAGVLITKDRLNTTGVALSLTSVSAAIISRVAAGAWTEQASISSVGNDVTWSIYYDPDANTYTVLKDGEECGLSWEDSGLIIPHDENTRYAGVQITREDGINGGEVDNFVLRDWAA